MFEAKFFTFTAIQWLERSSKRPKMACAAVDLSFLEDDSTQLSFSSWKDPSIFSKSRFHQEDEGALALDSLSWAHIALEEDLKSTFQCVFSDFQPVSNDLRLDFHLLEGFAVEKRAVQKLWIFGHASHRRSGSSVQNSKEKRSESLILY